MPMYEYLCNDCGYGFEQVQSFHDEPLTTCPECGGTVRRVIAPVGIIFKGSGWYITDSKRQITAGKAGAKAASGAEGTASSTDSESGDTRGGESATGEAGAGKVAAQAADAGGSEAPPAGKSGKADSGDSAAKTPKPSVEAKST